MVPSGPVRVMAAAAIGTVAGPGVPLLIWLRAWTRMPFPAVGCRFSDARAHHLVGDDSLLS